MHIPDGFLDLKTWAGSAAVGAGLVACSLTRARADLEERRLPTVGVMAAFIFAAQMVNFPVSGGTSGHLIGAVLAAVTLGPWTASLVMTTVLVVQCLVFGDGGVTALGANVLNMAFIATFAGYGAYLALRRVTREGLAVGVGAWISVVAAAAACSTELALSGTAPLGAVLPAMLGWHAIIGLGEAVITAAVAAYLWKVRPGAWRPKSRQATGSVVNGGNTMSEGADRIEA
ncbi:MAG: cobalamin biosynthesis protein CbiM [Bacillota bacterium]|nr:MAG: cobalamin biosynthesis protein CbiM [Bacillota bacterium]